jgi:hypothetical protein
MHLALDLMTETVGNPTPGMRIANLSVFSRGVARTLARLSLLGPAKGFSWVAETAFSQWFCEERFENGLR